VIEVRGDGVVAEAPVELDPEPAGADRSKQRDLVAMPLAVSRPGLVIGLVAEAVTKRRCRSPHPFRRYDEIEIAERSQRPLRVKALGDLRSLDQHGLDSAGVADQGPDLSQLVAQQCRMERCERVL
jgi:hypothetical protein